MSDQQPDEAELGAAKSGLSHVETKSGSEGAKLMFKCESCDHKEDISAEILDLMEADKPYEAPKHHDQPMKVFMSS